MDGNRTDETTAKVPNRETFQRQSWFETVLSYTILGRM